MLMIVYMLNGRSIMYSYIYSFDIYSLFQSLAEAKLFDEKDFDCNYSPIIQHSFVDCFSFYF